MKRPTMLVKALLVQIGRDLDLSVERDLQRIADRCEHEGKSFLTITLPLLSDALERGIEAGTFTCPSNFSRHGSLPRFMGGFFKRVFNKDGRLLDEPCPYTIAGIRQVCRFMKKLKLECSPKRNAQAIKHFIEVEDELRGMTSQVERKDSILDEISGILWSQVFPEPDHLDLVCHHGPGFTADRCRPNERYRIRRWNERSEFSFPSDLHCYPNYGAAAEESGGKWEGSTCNEGLEFLSICDEQPVRVVFVPKTQVAPRVIAIEPSHMQYMQQSIKDWCYRALESHRLTKRSIRFKDQSFNQRLACQASKDKRASTLDLKDASDRVHLHLVQRIFKTSGILQYLEDARSLHAVLPNGRNVILFKYASMGSALCFPVEAMVFYTLIQSIMHTIDGIRPSSRSIAKYSRQIAIYGDDLIVPVEYTDAIVKYLESYALKVNVNKSFKDSSFRESCGADFFDGVPVNPVYAREWPHDDSRSWEANTVMSWNATADLFYQRGQWHVCQVIRDMLLGVVRCTIPRSRKPGSGLSHLSFMFDTNCHYDSKYHSWRQKRIVYDPIKRKDTIDGDHLACLNKWGLSNHRRGLRHPGTQFRLEHVPMDAGVTTTTLPDGQRGVGGIFPDVRDILPGESVCSILERLEAFSDQTDSASRLRDDTTGHLSGCAPSGSDSAQQHIEQSLHERLSYLTDSKISLDFQFSVKRGAFKSKRRWVNLAG